MTQIFAAIHPLQAALDYHLDRQNILVSNLAHADTPGYVPRDLKRPSPFSAALDTAMGQGQPGQAAGDDAAASVDSIFFDRSGGAGYDGNYVSLDREAAKISENQSRYDVVSTAVGAQLRLLSYAANDGTGS